MEFEQLELGKKCLTSAITRQDVGDYYDLLHPNVLLVSHFEYPPAPPTVADTVLPLARGLRRTEAWAAKAKEKAEYIKTTRAANKSTASALSAATRGTTATGSVMTRSGSVSPGGPKQSKKGTGNYEVDIVEGPLLATERLYAILFWLNNGEYIAEADFEMEARKAILQESEKLPPPPPPKNEAEWYAQLGRQYTERNQRLSRLIVTFGREMLLFRDECYFEDGLIVTIHRFMLTPQEMLAYVGLAGCENQPQAKKRVENILAERENFYAARKVRVDMSSRATLPLLDFTFCKVPDPLHLLQVKPVSGAAHVCRELQPAVDPHFAQGVFLNQQSDPTRPQKDQRVIIRARNKQGEEEVYEFVENMKPRFGFLHDPKGMTEDSLDTLAGKLKSTYATSSVRISGCGMESTDNFVPVIRRLVANAIMTIRSLDLSDNHISVLPDFSLLPLQRLQLHQNKISDWAQIENRVCCLPLLHAVTMHGNPLAEDDPQYWPKALSRLLRNPARVVKLRQLDFVTLTLQDYSVAGAFDLFETGNPNLLEASRGRKPGTNGLKL